MKTKWFVIPLNIPNLLEVLRTLNCNLIDQRFIENDTKFIVSFEEIEGINYSCLSNCVEYTENGIRELINN